MSQQQSKYESLKEQILSDIAAGIYGPNDKIPSENELCRQYDISRITVRRAIDELVLNQYLYRIQGVGTFVKKQTQAEEPLEKIVLVQPNYEQLYSSGIVLDIIRGVESVLNPEGFSFVTIMEPRNEEDVAVTFRHIQNEHPAGVIYSFCYGTGVAERLKELHIPIVFLDAEPPIEHSFDVVTGEDAQSAYRAVCLAGAAGIRRVGFYSVWDKSFSTMRLRAEGVRRAIEDMNLEYKEGYIGIGEANTNNVAFHSDINRNQTVSDVKKFLQKYPELELIVVGNDDAAFALYKAAGELDIRIPDDLKVISYGNYNWNDFFKVGFTSFEQNFYQYGRKSAKLLVQRIRGELPAVSQRKLLPYKLIRRDSF